MTPRLRGGVVGEGEVAGTSCGLTQGGADDLEGTSVTTNVLLPGGATATAMVPDDAPAQVRANLLDPAIMGPPIVWLSSDDAIGVHDERIVARNFDDWLHMRSAPGPEET